MVQRMVETAQPDKLLVVALFNDCAILHHKNSIRILIPDTMPIAIKEDRMELPP